MKKVILSTSIFLVFSVLLSIIMPGVMATEEKIENTQNYIETIEDFTASKTKISNEVISLRERFTKHFRCEDGTYIASQYSIPVHYFNDNEWIQIDNTLNLNKDKLSSSGLPTYTNKSSDVSLSFPQNFSNGQSVEIFKNNHKFNMKIIGDEKSLALSTAKINNDYKIDYSTEEMSDVELYNDKIMTIDKLVSEIIYPSISKDVDLEYTISSSKIKENIVINAKKEKYSFEFEIDYADLTPIVNNDGSISFFDKKDSEPIFTIDAPYMYDSSGEKSNKIKMILKGNILTLIADDEWINSWKRKFPVIIDPSVTTASMSASSTYVSYAHQANNYYQTSTLYAGKYLTDTRRTYIKYVLPNLPNNAVINDAEIGLILNNCLGLFGSNCQYIYFFDLTGKGSWSPSTLTWNNQPLSTSINGPLNDGTSIVATFKGNILPHHIFRFDATQKVKNWYENNNNNGIMVTTSNETSNVQPSFYSYYDSYDKPYITVEYTCNVGYEDYWSYHVKDIGRSGKVMVNTYNGSYLYTHEDASTNGLVFPVTVSHIYNSDNSFLSGTVGNMNFGKGFRLNIIETMIAQDGDTIIYTDSDGTSHNFNRSINSGTLYYHEDDSTIELINTNNTYTVNYRDGSSKFFDSSGYLTCITDKNGNQININYSNNKIMSISDGANKSITFEYDSNNYLTSITDFAGRVTQYVYNSDRLDKIIYSDSTETKFRFDPLYLEYVIDTSGTKTEIIYSDHYYLTNYYLKVAHLVTYQKNTSDIAERYIFSYNGRSTKITDFSNDYVTIVYDNCGRVISYETNNDTKTNRIFYNTTGNLRNKVSYSSYSFSSATNLINKSKWSVLQWSGNLPSSVSRVNDTTKKYTYNSSIKFTGNASNLEISPGNITVEPEETYTLMANIQIDDTMFGGKVFLRMTAGSEIKTSAFLTTTDSSWRFIATAITIPQGVTNLTIELVAQSFCGSFYVDSVQLVKGGQTSYFNLIPDSNFTAAARYLGESNWTAMCPVDKYNYGDYGLRVKGSYLEDRYFTQIISASGLANEKFVFGISSKAECYDIGLESFYGAKITFILGGNDVCTRTLIFDKDKYDNWQNILTEVSSTSDFDQIKLELHYDLYEGYAFFNNLFLYKNCGFGYKYSYNEDGNITQLNFGTNNSITISYLGANISSIAKRSGNTLESNLTYTYDSNNNVLTKTDNYNNVTTYTYPTSNNKGLPLSVSVSNNGLSSTTSYTYTSDYNHVNSVTDSAGSIITYTYDPITELVSCVTDPRGNNIYYEYDPTGSVITSISSDDMNECIYNNEPVITDLTYDNSFRLIGISICNDDMFYDLSYDGFGRSYNISCANYGTINDYSYNSDSTIADVNYGNGDSVHCEYNNKRELSSVVFNDNSEIDYIYTDNGQLAEIYDEDNQLMIYYRYNSEGQILDSSRNNIKNVSYKYDLLNRPNGYTVTENDNTVLRQDYSYDSKDRVYKINYSGPLGHIDYYYDSLGRVECATNIYNSIECDVCYTYKTNGNNQTGYVDTIDYLIDFDESNKMIPSLSYDYDENGNVVAVYENGNQVISYMYDNLNRLILECNALINCSFYYEYNNLGDIQNSSRFVFCGFNCLDFADDMDTYSYDNEDWKSLLSKYNDEDFEYDENGNPTLYRGYTMTWQRGKQLASAVNIDYNITYKYDYNGIRTKKTVNGFTTEYFYEGSTLLGQKTGNNTIYFIYDVFGSPYGFIYNGTSYFYLLNLQGDVIGIYDSNNNLVVRYYYNAWGMLFSTTGTLASTIGEINPLRYRGYYYDSETKLYYLQSRYYDPEICRFISADTYIVAGNYLTGTNMFAYCLNNPVMYSDPSGTEANKVLVDIMAIFLTAEILVESLSIDVAIEVAKQLSESDLSGIELIQEAKNSTDNWINRKDKRKGSDERQKTGARERNVGHPNGEEHSRKPKGTSGVKKATAILATVGIVILVADDITGVGVIDDVALPILVSLVTV